jgi:hypothetical protein
MLVVMVAVVVVEVPVGVLLATDGEHVLKVAHDRALAIVVQRWQLTVSWCLYWMLIVARARRR